MSNWVVELKKPVNLISIVIAVFSLSFAVITYDSRSDGRELSYRVLNSKALDFKWLASVIELYDENGLRLKDDVYVSYISLWNSGKKLIEKEDVVEIISIDFNSIGRVLTIEEIASKWKGEANIGATISGNTVKFDLDNLDIDMGAKYRLVYTRTYDRPNGWSVIFQYFFSSTARADFNILSGYIREGEIVNSMDAQRTPIYLALLLLLMLGFAIAIILALKSISIYFGWEKVLSTARTLYPYVSTPIFVLLLYLTISVVYLVAIGVEPDILHINMSDPGLRLGR